VVLLFSLALIMNVNTTAAASTNNTTLKVTSVDPANHAIIPKSQSINVKFSKTIKTGKVWIVLKTSKGKTISVKNQVKNNKLTITPKTTLSSGKYYLSVHSGSVTDLNGNKNKLISTSFTLYTINLSQMKTGINTAEKYYANNGKLPKSVTVGSYKLTITEFKKIIATQGLTIKKPKVVSAALAVSQVMKAASKYKYSSAAHTGKDMERIGSGDCWAMSDYLYTHLTKKGVKSRIIQYATAYSSNHRSVQYYCNNKWVNVPYRKYFSTNLFNNTQSTGTVIKG
jgi:methionine-rich copper-binding protein CopC